MILADLGATPDCRTLTTALADSEGPAAIRVAPRLMAALEDGDARAALKETLAASRRQVLAAILDVEGLPGWERPYRAALAIGAAELLADLNPQRTRAWIVASAGDGAGHGTYSVRVAAFCHDLHVQTRRVVCLCLTDLERASVAALADAKASATLAGLAAIGAEAAEAALKLHLGLARRTREGIFLLDGAEQVAIRIAPYPQARPE